MRKRDNKGKFIKMYDLYSTCLNCGRKNPVSPSRLKIGEGKYCNRKCQHIHYKGRHMSPKTEVKKGSIEERSIAWRGDKVGYHGVHIWIRKRLGRPDTCKKCGKSGLSGGYIQWANISGKYKRDVNDWIRLCASCHKKYDLGLTTLDNTSMINI